MQPIIAEMAQALAVFHATLVERRELDRERQLLAELTEWLQSCNSLGELYQMMAQFLGRLLPTCAGSLYIYANSRDVLENAKSWNGGETVAAMRPEDWWGLRRGRPYFYGESEISFPCAHVAGSVSPTSTCGKTTAAAMDGMSPDDALGEHLGDDVLLADVSLGNVLDGHAGGTSQLGGAVAHPIPQRFSNSRIVEDPEPPGRKNAVIPCA